MESWNLPTNDELARLVALVGRPENRAYFFDRLANPEWVTPLASRSYFANPPSPMPADRPGYVWFPPWPEGRYLARMAPLAPKSVAEVLSRHRRSNNPVVTRIALEAFAALPDDEVTTLAATVTEWIRPPGTEDNIADYAEHFADEALVAIRCLFSCGALSRGLSAVDSLLKPVPTMGIGSQHQVSGRMSDWKYGRVLEALVPVVVDVTALQGLRRLSWLLIDAIRVPQAADATGGSEDAYSFIWRPAIEVPEQNRGDGVRGALISAVRDAALRYSQSGEAALRETVLELEDRSLIHRRIALHVLANATGGMALVEARITRRELFDDHRIWHEYGQLVRARFDIISPEVQDTYLRWIDEGPDLDALRQPRFTGYIPTDEDVACWVEGWKRDHLSFIVEYLPERWMKYYRELVERRGEPEHPDFAVRSFGAATIEQPTGGDEIAGKVPADVIQRLRMHDVETIVDTSAAMHTEGLCRTFQAMVKEQSTAFAVLAREVATLRPTFISSFMRGLEEAAKGESVFAWEEPLHLAEAVVAHPFASSGDETNQEQSDEWRWARHAVASLVRAGFSDRSNRIPFSLRELVWTVLERLTHDPYVSIGDEIRANGRLVDAFTQSINTNRGLAMHGVVEYVLWCRRELEVLGADLSQGWHSCPRLAKPLIDISIQHMNYPLSFERSTETHFRGSFLLTSRGLCQVSSGSSHRNRNWSHLEMPCGLPISCGTRPTTQSMNCYRGSMKRE